jgi:hypothetical protein
MSLSDKGMKPTHVTVDQVAATAAAVVDSVNPGAQQPRSDQIEIQVDPQMLQQATQMKNARLIASLVHESAMLEVALEQARRESGEWKAKHDALRQALDSD